MFLTILLLSIGIVALAFVGLGVSIFFKKNGKFPETGVGHNPEMRKLGLNCAKSEEIKRFQLQKDIKATQADVPALQFETSGCAGCSCSAE
jgi:hypothetical protein